MITSAVHCAAADAYHAAVPQLLAPFAPKRTPHTVAPGHIACCPADVQLSAIPHYHASAACATLHAAHDTRAPVWISADAPLLHSRLIAIALQCRCARSCMQIVAVSSAATAFRELEDNGVPPLTLAAWRLQATTLVLILPALYQWGHMAAEAKLKCLQLWWLLAASGALARTVSGRGSCARMHVRACACSIGLSALHIA